MPKLRIGMNEKQQQIPKIIKYFFVIGIKELSTILDEVPNRHQPPTISTGVRPKAPPSKSFFGVPPVPTKFVRGRLRRGGAQEFLHNLAPRVGQDSKFCDSPVLMSNRGGGVSAVTTEALFQKLGGCGYDEWVNRLAALAGHVAPSTQSPKAGSKRHRVRLGDIWRLGVHRLMCGDARAAKDVGRLMNWRARSVVLYLRRRTLISEPTMVPRQRVKHLGFH